METGTDKGADKGTDRPMERYAVCPPTHLTFDQVISRRSAYGLIWSGYFRQAPCVTKVVMLDTGIHYDRDQDVHRDGLGTIIPSHRALPIFGRTLVGPITRPPPFWHEEFCHRRSTSLTQLLDEVSAQDSLGSLTYSTAAGQEWPLVPKIYGFGVNHQHRIHYGIIVMERMTCSMKDLLMQRPLSLEEEEQIGAVIDYLHWNLGYVHGDLKPGNIGLNLGKGRVQRVSFFDCQSMRHRSQISTEQFDSLLAREVRSARAWLPRRPLQGQAP